MDDSYFSPTVLLGKPGSQVVVDLENDGIRPHNFSLTQQGIDVDCGVSAKGHVRVTFPHSGLLMFFCKYTATSGMRGGLLVRRPK